MSVNRRLGAESSATRAALLDAVEAIMRSEGYGALTARRVAERAELKHQLVFYYFENMDDLLITSYRRHTDRYRESIERTLVAERPLHALWALHSNTHDATLNMEYLALANHNEAVRQHTAAFGEEVRRLGLDVLERKLALQSDDRGAISALGIIVAITSVGSIIGLENAIGISGGHRETHALLSWCLDQIEPPVSPPCADAA
jgi:AcrR family transcriptional regulator